LFCQFFAITWCEFLRCSEKFCEYENIAPQGAAFAMCLFSLGFLADRECLSSNSIFDILEEWNRVLEPDRASIQAALKSPDNVQKPARKVQGPTP